MAPYSKCPGKEETGMELPANSKTMALFNIDLTVINLDCFCVRCVLDVGVE